MYLNLAQSSLVAVAVAGAAVDVVETVAVAVDAAAAVDSSDLRMGALARLETFRALEKILADRRERNQAQAQEDSHQASLEASAYASWHWLVLLPACQQIVPPLRQALK